MLVGTNEKMRTCMSAITSRAAGDVRTGPAPQPTVQLAKKISPCSVRQVVVAEVSVPKDVVDQGQTIPNVIVLAVLIGSRRRSSSGDGDGR